MVVSVAEIADTVTYGLGVGVGRGLGLGERVGVGLDRGVDDAGGVEVALAVGFGEGVDPGFGVGPADGEELTVGDAFAIGVGSASATPDTTRSGVCLWHERSQQILTMWLPSSMSAGTTISCETSPPEFDLNV